VINARARAEINFDAHSENPLKWVKFPNISLFSPFTLREVCAYNGLELLALGFNPRWTRNAAGRWDVI
jgi:hypothetical protein